jgi:hypothetical protein
MSQSGRDCVIFSTASAVLARTHWLETAIRKTALPFAGMTLGLVAIGWTVQWIDPSAVSIGEFLSHRR